MLDEEDLWHLALTAVPEFGDVAYQKLTRTFGSVTAAVAASSAWDFHASPCGQEAVKGILRALKRVDSVRPDALALAEREISLSHPRAEDYPPHLKGLAHPPFALFHLGPLPGGEPAIAIVGARQCSEAGAWIAHACAAEAARKGCRVISGYAHGIDRAAHRGALSAGGCTGFVIPEGILHFLERSRHTSLIGDGIIFEQGSTLISQFYPRHGVCNEYLIRRNRTILGLSQGTLVVEAGKTGGTQWTARETLRNGRPLWVLDWGDDLSPHEGNRELIQAGGIPLSAGAGAEEILRCMGFA